MNVITTDDSEFIDTDVCLNVYRRLKVGNG